MREISNFLIPLGEPKYSYYRIDKQELNDRVKNAMALLSDQLYIADQQSEMLREEIRGLKLKQKNNK